MPREHVSSPPINKYINTYYIYLNTHISPVPAFYGGTDAWSSVYLLY